VRLLADHERAVPLHLHGALQADRVERRLRRLRGELALPVERGGVAHHIADLAGGDAPAPTAGAALVVLPAQPGLQLLHRQVQRPVRVARRGFGPYHGAAVPERDLYPVGTVGLARVELLGQLHVQARHLAVDPLDLLQLELLGHMPPESLRHLCLTALDDDVHAELRSRTAPPLTAKALLTSGLRLSPPPPLAEKIRHPTDTGTGGEVARKQ
jgi:hypothetical protein